MISEHNHRLETQNQELVKVEQEHTCVCTEEQNVRTQLCELQRRQVQLEIEDKVCGLYIVTPLNSHNLKQSHPDLTPSLLELPPTCSIKRQVA